MAAYLQGDEQALEALVQNYYRLVVATATRATRDPHLAQDIAQTVFLIFARKARGLRKEVSLPGWFMRTALFVSRDAVKKVARRSYYETAGSAQPDDAGQDYEVTGAGLLLTEAVLALSPREQVCVLARFYDERAMTDIARDHGISEDAVQKRIERGLEKMRRFFARRGFRITAGVVPALFVAGFPRGAEAQAIQLVLNGVHAAKTASATTTSLVHANQILHELSRRKALSLALKSGAALLLASAGVGGFVVFHEPSTPALPPFRPSTSQVDTLGRAWAQVARQVAGAMANVQAGRQAAANAQFAAVITESVRISAELVALQTPENERTIMAEFLTIELRETLTLSERQQAYVYSLFTGQLANGDSLFVACKAMLAAKDTLAEEIRAHLTFLQKRRFDSTYGKNALGFLGYVGAAAFGQ